MDGIKKNLRAVLLSKAGGVPLKLVEKDYRNLVGDSLRWRQYDFKSFDQFLNAIPDVAQIQMKNGELYVFGIAENMAYVNATARKAQFKNKAAEPQTDQPGSSDDVTVYVGSLPLDFTEEELKDLLSAYQFKHVRIKNQDNFACAWIDTSKQTCDQMCSELNRKRCKDRYLKVEPSRSKASLQNRNKNLPNHSSSSDAEYQRNSNMKSRHPSTTSTTYNMDAGDRQFLPLSVATEVKCSAPSARVEPLLIPTASDFNRSNNCNPSTFHFAESSAVQSSNSPDVKFVWDSDDEMPDLVDSDRYDEYLQSRKPKVSSTERDVFHQSQDARREGCYGNSTTGWPAQSNGARRESYHGNSTSGQPAPRNDARRESYLDNSTSQSAPRNDARREGYPGNSTSGQPAPRSDVRMESCSNSANTHLSALTPSYYIEESIKHQNNKTQKLDTGRPGSNPSQGKQPRQPAHAFEVETFNLYVKGIPAGTRVEEMQSLFPGCLKVVPLSQASCFIVFATLEEVKNVALKKWVIRGVELNVDVATRHKKQEGNDSDPVLSDVNVQFENLTCTIDQNSQRKVHVEKANENIAQQKPNSGDESLSMSQSESSVKGDVFNQKPFNVNVRSPVKTESSQLTSTEDKESSDFTSPHRAKNRQRMNSRDSVQSSSVQSYLPPAVPYQTGPVGSGLDHSRELDDRDRESAVYSLHNPDQIDLVPGARSLQNDVSRNPSRSADESHSSQFGRPGISSSAVYGNSMSSLAASTSSSLMPSLRAVPDEMRVKELQGFYKDTCPSGVMPSANTLSDVIDIIVTCIVSGFDNKYFWGQLVSVPWQAEMRQLCELGLKMKEIAMNPASAQSKRGTTKYCDEWCRIWIKEQGETNSKVFFIDYGNFETVSNSEIFELPEEFWKIRPAALPFRVMDCEQVDISEFVNGCITAKVNKGPQRSVIFDVCDIRLKLS